jgi:hypothetical protein
MKQLHYFTRHCLLFYWYANSLWQSVPQGMKYQAVARDLSGEVMADQAIAIKIALQGNGAKTVHYTAS